MVTNVGASPKAESRDQPFDQKQQEDSNSITTSCSSSRRNRNIQNTERIVTLLASLNCPAVVVFLAASSLAAHMTILNQSVLMCLTSYLRMSLQNPTNLKPQIPRSANPEATNPS